MSKYFRDNGFRYYPEFGESRTKQAFKDDCDINKILAKAQKVGTLSHLQRHGAFYGDFSEAPADLMEAQALLERGQVIFDELPSEIRKEFKNKPMAFFEFVNDPANKDRLHEVLPQIAAPGKYFPDVSAATPPGAPLGAPSDVVASSNTPAAGSSESPATGDTGPDVA